MYTISILENGECKNPQIAGKLCQLTNKHNKAALLCAGNNYLYLKHQKADLLVIAPGIYKDIKIREKCVLLPGNITESGKIDIEAEYGVSYGLSPRDTITASSISDNGIILSLQREMITLSGELVERQELPLLRGKGLNPEFAMVVAGALLLAGVSPENLSL